MVAFAEFGFKSDSNLQYNGSYPYAFSRRDFYKLKRVSPASFRFYLYFSIPVKKLSKADKEMIEK